MLYIIPVYLMSSPLPAAKWSGELDASSPSPLCLQYNTILSPLNPVEGVEDCLTVDITTPVVTDTFSNGSCSKLYPVIALNSAGGWSVLGAATYGPLFLMDNDVVSVAINSRVGILGYLSTEDTVIPGNFGLKDQQLALKWIQDNIETLCGDPNSVTITGDSSGAASAFLHSYSPKSRGLTHRIVALSGTANNYWAVASTPKLKAQRLGVLLNCSNPNDSAQLLTCLRDKDAKDIESQIESFKAFGSSPFAPVVEAQSEDAFLTINPLHLLEHGRFEKKPVIMSTITGEGLVPGALLVANEKLVENLDGDWLQTAPLLLDYNYTVTSEDRETVSSIIREHYFGNHSISKETLPILINMVRDRRFVSDAAYTATQLACHNPKHIYYFIFNYFGSTNSATYLGPTIEELKPFGPAHGDDFGYIYNLTYLYQAKSNDDIAIVKAMTKMIATFATTGEATFGPDTTWEPLDKEACKTNILNHLFIESATDYKMADIKNLGDFEFWNTLPLWELGTKRSKHRQCKL